MKFFYLVLFLSVSAAFARQQTDNTVLAKVGSQQITSEEYKIRFELSPHIGLEKWNEDSLRYSFLYSLIAEKLWAEEAAAMGMDTLPQFRFLLKPVEKLFVKDALYKQEVESKISISENEVTEGINKSMYALSLDIISSQDSSQIYMIHSLLSKGAAFDSLRRVYDPQSSGLIPLVITYSQLDNKEMEDSLYNLKPLQYTAPVKNDYAWFIFKLLDKNANRVDDISKLRRSVVKLIKERKARKIGTAYWESVFQPLNIEAERSLFDRTAAAAAEVIKAKLSSGQTDTSGLAYFGQSEALNLISSLDTETLDSVLIKFDTSPVSLREFLYYISIYGVSSKSGDFTSVSYRLNDLLRTFIEEEVLAREGVKRGLDKLPEVQTDINMWRTNYLGQLYKNSYTDSSRVSESELENYLSADKSESGKQVKLAEIRTSQLSVIESILIELAAGKDFLRISSEYDKTLPVESEFRPVSALGETGRIASEMSIGEVYGPLKIGDEYSIFKLLDVKDASDSVLTASQQPRENAYKELFYKKLTEHHTAKTIQLADKYNIEINDNVLKQIDAPKLNMFVKRFIGFGGVTAAVPFTAPWYKWYKEWQQKQLAP